ncbi:hypothetical protein PGTUg99_026548 [Puccinia graminis f. sp. tritici]|uniref:Uncharacterized protein n=2 Tax=Puccinia graminis f. sp. tritici TaxID=56615 RepID=H6QQ19_PUCGT|nr:uncharacterized protein PGTG_20965 [Puccinia graminis f. sp. tritici CRL 75-36-700-3]EHS64502.1 hypothetical protein PGTG_20965 [Puccinia graminis f. sp. tritici CRL 75-36-700-3]KAA1128697.1 hypothetical protein PGTUg99_026548 [Puccinia graminis f. sp. tritici]
MISIKIQPAPCNSQFESNDVVECEIYVKQEKEQNEEEEEKNVVVVHHIDADLILINRVHISANLAQLGGLKTDQPRWRDRT